MTVEKITLLSKEEYKKHKDSILALDDISWWLRAPSTYSDFAHYHHGGCIYSGNPISNITKRGVRPTLLLNIEPTEPEFWCKPEKLVGKKVTYGDFTWTILEVKNSQIYVLCDKIIAKHMFDENPNKWEISELKAWLETEGLDIIEGIEKHDS